MCVAIQVLRVFNPVPAERKICGSLKPKFRRDETETTAESEMTAPPTGST